MHLIRSDAFHLFTFHLCTLKSRFLKSTNITESNADLFNCCVGGDGFDDRGHSVFVVAGGKF